MRARRWSAASATDCPPPVLGRIECVTGFAAVIERPHAPHLSQPRDDARHAGTAVKQLAKRIFYAVAPRTATAFMSARSRAHSQRVVASWGCASITRKLIERFGSRVQEGPFAGL